jgi:hypothetical protein
MTKTELLELAEELANDWDDANTPYEVADKAAAALREYAGTMEQEPQCHQINSGVRCTTRRYPGERLCPDCNPNSSRKQEPVAWIHKHYLEIPMQYGFTVSPVKVAEQQKPLYASPPSPQRTPLTNYELTDLWIRRPSIHDGELIPQLYDFARAIEAAHGITAQEKK